MTYELTLTEITKYKVTASSLEEAYKLLNGAWLEARLNCSPNITEGDTDMMIE